MSRSVKSSTVSSHTIENDEIVQGGVVVDVDLNGVSAHAPALANHGTATATVSGNKVTVVQTAGTPTTGATITVLHNKAIAPRAVAVALVSGPNDPQAVALRAAISATQFVISVVVAPSAGAGTWVYEFVFVD